MADKDYSATPLATKLGAKPGVDVLLFFTTSRAELQRRFAALKETLAPADGLWIAWPQTTAGLVDNKSAAIDGKWQAVRFVYRKKDRPR